MVKIDGNIYILDKIVKITKIKKIKDRYGTKYYFNIYYVHSNTVYEFISHTEEEAQRKYDILESALKLKYGAFNF